MWRNIFASVSHLSFWAYTGLITCCLCHHKKEIQQCMRQEREECTQCILIYEVSTSQHKNHSILIHTQWSTLAIFSSVSSLPVSLCDPCEIFIFQQPLAAVSVIQKCIYCKILIISNLNPNSSVDQTIWEIIVCTQTIEDVECGYWTRGIVVLIKASQTCLQHAHRFGRNPVCLFMF
jgi:hypothetical protein